MNDSLSNPDETKMEPSAATAEGASSAAPVPAAPVPAAPVPAETVPAETVPAAPVPVETVPAETVPAETVPAETVPVETGDAVAVPVPMGVAVYQSTAFALSALLSPYLVIPVGTVGIVASQPDTLQHLIKWTGLSILFSTVIPALYVVLQILRGKITDVHVMEREQRGGPFLVAIISSAIGAATLCALGAPRLVWMMGVVLAVNGVVLLSITNVWKISMHVAVLSATVLAALIAVPDIFVARALVWLIPALMWARVTRGRHSIWQGVAGCVVASLITGVVFYSINLWHKVVEAMHRFF